MMCSAGCECDGMKDDGLPKDDLPTYEAQPEQALAALMYLMSRFPARQSPAIAASIVSHLRLLESDTRFDESIRRCAEQMIDAWRGYAVLTSSDGPCVVEGRLLS